jgi:hypothetical protein
MLRRYLPHAAATASILATAVIAAWGFRTDPDRAYRWLVLGALLPAIWAYVEFAQVRADDAEVGTRIMTVHRCVIAFAGLMVSSEVGLRLSVYAGVLDPSWVSTGLRLRGLILGAGMVVFGNMLPTLRSPWPFRRQPFAWQQVHRFVGWTFVLGGLGIVGSWAFLPLDYAVRSSVLIGTIVCTLALGRKLASLTARSFGQVNGQD